MMTLRQVDAGEEDLLKFTVSISVKNRVVDVTLNVVSMVVWASWAAAVCLSANLLC